MAKFKVISRFSACSVFAFVGVGIVGSGSVFAQEADGTDVPKVQETITVTASRVDRPGYQAPTPTSVIGLELLNDSAAANVADVINELPQIGDGVDPRSSGNDVGSGSQGANFLNLRGIGTNRTLVLLDNRRVVASAATGQVDINMLPTTLLKQVEVVSGGASAAWGSDAVAGVVNLVLDKEYTGLKGGIQAGISGQDDAQEFRAELGGGLKFDNERGHILGSVSYVDIASVDRADSRDWFRGTKVVNNPNAGAPGQPARLVVDNTGTFLGSDIGHVFLGPPPGAALAGLFLDGSGNRFDFGIPSGPFAFGGATENDLSARSQIQADVKQINTFLRAAYDVSEQLNVYGEFLYGQTEAQSLSVPYYRFAGAVRARRDNPYLPTSIAAAMDGVGLTGPADSIPLALTNFGLGRATPYNERDVTRFVVGADYEVNENWSLSAYYERGESNVLNEARNDAIKANYALAVDAALDPGTGAIVCRSTLTDPANGCVPLNVFGANSASPEAIDYIIGTAVRDTKLTQDVAAISMAGDVLQLPAGPVSVAFGAEYRKEQLNTNADPVSQIDGFWVGNYKPAAGEYDVSEFFAEAVVPVFRNENTGQGMDLNAAVRSTDYSTSGNVTTWKLGSTIDVGAGFRLRGAASRDIRAPNLNEYFSGGQTNSLFFDDPENLDLNGVPLNYLVVRTIQGNPNLDPEEADTTTLGIVFQPEFLSGLRLAVDYVDIEISGSIGSVVDNTIPQRCFDGQSEFCDLITRDPGTNLMTNILNAPVNFSTEKFSAVDFEASYGFEFAGGDVDLRTFWTHTDKHSLTDGDGNVDNLLGEIAGGNAPGGSSGPVEWKGFNSVRYSNSNGFSGSLRYRYVGEGVLDADWVSGVDIDNNTVDAVHYVDLTLAKSFEINDHFFEVYGGVDNLFDEQPPRAPLPTGPTLDSLGVSNAAHDLIGRYFRVGARFEF